MTVRTSCLTLISERKDSERDSMVWVRSEKRKELVSEEERREKCRGRKGSGRRRRTNLRSRPSISEWDQLEDLESRRRPPQRERS